MEKFTSTETMVLNEFIKHSWQIFSLSVGTIFATYKIPSKIASANKLIKTTFFKVFWALLYLLFWRPFSLVSIKLPFSSYTQGFNIKSGADTEGDHEGSRVSLDPPPFLETNLKVHCNFFPEKTLRGYVKIILNLLINHDCFTFN